MKKSILLAALLLAVVALAGCNHPEDILDGQACAAASVTQA